MTHESPRKPAPAAESTSLDPGGTAVSSATPGSAVSGFVGPGSLESPHVEATAPDAAPQSSSEGAAVEVLGWGWRHAGRRKWTLRDISLTITPGERVLLLGASGSGKSTLLAGIAGILGGDDEGDTEGTLLIDGKPSARQRGRVGLVMQDPESQVVLERVGDDVAFGCENLGVARHETWTRVDEALSLVGADMHPLHSTSELSGGQKQRLALASVLAMRPGLLLLDEPTANLDPHGVREVRAAAESVLSHTGATAIIVEHRVDVWADLIDRVIVLVDGAIEIDGPFITVMQQHAQRLRDLGMWVPGDEERVAAEVTQTAASELSPLAAFLPISNTTALPTSHHSVDRSMSPPTQPSVNPSINARSASEPASLGQPRESRQPAPVALSAQGLAVGYSADAAIRTDIDLQIRQGQTTCIVGENGCGKSTLALTLAGLLPPVEGEVQAGSHLRPTPDSGAPHEWRSTELLGRIAMVFQEPEYQFLETTVRAELEVGPRLSGRTDEECNALVDEYLNILGLTHLAGAHPMSLSGGEKRRLSVATALISAPRVLILDEPTFGQDRKSWKELVRLFQYAVAQGTTLVAITHDQAFIAALADDVIDLGTIGTMGSAKERSLRDEHPSGTRTAAQASEARHDGGRGLVSRVNPVMQVLGVMLMTTPIMVSVDVVTAGVALLLELLLLPLVGMSSREVLTRSAPLFIAAPLAAVSMLLYGRAGGTIWWEFGPAIISDNSIALSASIALRIFALALPVILLFPRIDPTDMADGLTQILKLPARPVIASLAAARMMGLMMQDWRALQRARRIRGRGDSRGVTAFVQSAFAILVFALRRSGKLSITMEARGFGSPTPRSHARVSQLRRADYLMLALSLALPVVYISAAIHAGTFDFLGLTR